MKSGIFLKRLNRFVASVRLQDGDEVLAHVANTGRLRELLLPGAPCKLIPAANPNRKTAWNLEWILQRGRWVCLRSVYANAMVQEWLLANRLATFQNIEDLQPEPRVGRNRFDFRFTLDNNPWMAEIKAVNLVTEKGLGLFPDAPTSRGSRHLEELALLREEGYRTALILVVMGQKVDRVRFNAAHDPLFAATARAGAESGLVVRAYRSFFEPPEAFFDGEIPIDWGD